MRPPPRARKRKVSDFKVLHLNNSKLTAQVTDIQAEAPMERRHEKTVRRGFARARVPLVAEPAARDLRLRRAERLLDERKEGWRRRSPAHLAGLRLARDKRPNLRLRARRQRAFGKKPQKVHRWIGGVRPPGEPIQRKRVEELFQRLRAAPENQRPRR